MLSFYFIPEAPFLIIEALQVIFISQIRMNRYFSITKIFFFFAKADSAEINFVAILAFYKKIFVEKIAFFNVIKPPARFCFLAKPKLICGKR